MPKIDYKLVVQVLEGWRLTIPLDLRVKADVKKGEPFLAQWNPELEQFTFTRLNLQVAGGTLTW